MMKYHILQFYQDHKVKLTKMYRDGKTFIKILSLPPWRESTASRTMDKQSTWIVTKGLQGRVHLKSGFSPFLSVH